MQYFYLSMRIAKKTLKAHQNKCPHKEITASLAISKQMQHSKLDSEGSSFVFWSSLLSLEGAEDPIGAGVVCSIINNLQKVLT